jgi:hypothetical protein
LGSFQPTLSVWTSHITNTILAGVVFTSLEADMEMLFIPIQSPSEEFPI